MTTTFTPALEFRQVSIAFDEKPLLDGISFVVPRGQMRIVLGPSNCGKSTLIRLAIGLLKPDAGEVWLNGIEISALPEEELLELRQTAGVVLQTDALFDMSVAENIAYRLPLLGFDSDQTEAEVRRVLQIVGLEDAYDLQPEELSGGMSRRAALARALAGAPPIMFYDSPCSGLDPIISRRIMREVLRQRDVVGVSSLYVTQNLDEVRYLCSHYYETPPHAEPELRAEADDFCLTNTRILLLNEGQIIFNQEDELFWDSTDERIRRFVL
ncbi:MAG: ATP-binding cassette domain-containing protein [Acidobacteria bacterium]|nr:ATP-binding cassette domain-containing protein [Acidobacteriota bacterium]MBI3422210.1 ATP-binding cassette domain-containing protein [Acidobacteriota bacterium]